MGRIGAVLLAAVLGVCSMAVILAHPALAAEPGTPVVEPVVSAAEPTTATVPIPVTEPEPAAEPASVPAASQGFSMGNTAAQQNTVLQNADIVPAGYYRINGVMLPLQEKGYRTGDYRGAGLCWQFARHIYYNIWGCFFYQNPGSDDDMLRDYPGGEYRRITAENARFFISEAPVGAVIRIQSTPDGPDITEGNRHSLILLDKSEYGCTVYHDWRGYSTISTLTWSEFENMFRTNIDFGYFKYIKYPAAKQLLYEDTTEDMTRELLVSSRIYGTVELVEKKR